MTIVKPIVLLYCMDFIYYYGSFKHEYPVKLLSFLFFRISIYRDFNTKVTVDMFEVQF